MRDYAQRRRTRCAASTTCFHAAALKQVPSCEFYPMEAVRTNVLGTENVLDAAIAARRASAWSCLSTDKAVYPINAMGMSKAMMEKVMVAKSRNLDGASTVICGTRYGNVMASRGSVIPLFVEQVQAGQPLTVTDPAMTRFMMSLDEAVDLVLYAFEHGSNGDIFVQKAPAATVETLAQALLRAAGKPRARGQRDRHPPRREAVRDAAHPRGDGRRRGPGRLLPRAARHPRPELRASSSNRASRGSRAARTTTRTTPSGSTSTGMKAAAAEARLHAAHRARRRTATPED